tara:strand:+ start:5681 stop:7861 length:2181 start_codon:yes stop_codon:yes gene_type:complete
MSETAKKNIQTYICTGCDIGQCLDVEKLKKVPQESAEEVRQEEAKNHEFLCGKQGLEMIRKDIEGGVNCAIIAACSGRVLTHRFNFGASVMVERVNLREGVVWVSEPKNEDTQMLAEDYIKMGVIKTEKWNYPDPYLEELAKTILVVGGGIAGITAARESALAGYSIILVEKKEQLGGFALNLKKCFPSKGKFEELEETGIEQKIEQLKKDPRVRIFTGSEIKQISGQPGLFEVEMDVKGKKENLRVGVIIQATGFKPYDANKLGHLGYGKFKNIVTGVEFEEMASKGEIKRPSDGGQARNVIFVQCAGSRDEKHLPYCSTVCCMTSLKQAVYLREQDKKSRAFILYKDIRTPAHHEFFYKKVQEDDGIFFTKSEEVFVEGDLEGDGEDVVVSAHETLLGEDIKIKADLVVLATGMETANQNGGALKLNYRQGPELPELNYGFPDSHFICFPYETRRTGIYAAGTVRHPMNMAQAEQDAKGAALKAIQCIELSSQGKSVHPRVGDTSYPEINMSTCTQCKRCTEECPFGMYDEDEKFNPLPNPLRCRRCATCMGACPQRIINFKDYHMDMLSSMTKCFSMPPEEDEKPRVVIFACENDIIPALDAAGVDRLKLSPFIRVIPLRCAGSMPLVFVSDALSAGVDGVLVLGCKHGDDYQCHNIKGSELANERIGKVEETLSRIQLESERVQFQDISINEHKKLPKIINEFMDMIERVGPNPFKEFADFS